jgi:Ras-related protein Rab-8A
MKGKMAAACDNALESGAAKDIDQCLAGLREGKAKEYIVVAVLGGKDSGKTSLVSRFIQGTWKPTSPTQRFVDFQCGNLVIRGKPTQVVTCDYAGSNEYRLVQKTMFPPTKSVPVNCMLIVDLSRKQSQEDLMAIVNGLVVPRLNSKCPPESYLLVGCKSDLRRDVSPSEVANLTRVVSGRLGKPVQYIETSAKEGKNVSDAFALLVSSGSRQK